MKKQVLAIIIVLALSLTLLAGCGGNTGGDNSTAGNKTTSSAPANNTTSSAPANTGDENTGGSGKGWPAALLPGVPEFKTDFGMNYGPFAGAVTQVSILGSSMESVFEYVKQLHEAGWKSAISDDLTEEALSAKIEDNFGEFKIWNDNWDMTIRKLTDTNFYFTFNKK